MAHYNVDSFRQREALKAGKSIEIKAERLSSPKRKTLSIARMNAGKVRKKRIRHDLESLRRESEARRATRRDVES